MREDFVRAVCRTVGQFFHLSIDLPYHPLQPLATLARVRADVLREHIFHVPVERDTLDLHGRFLLQQRLGRVGRVWNVAECFVHGKKAAKGEVDRLERHQSFPRIDGRLFTGVADVRGANELLGPLWEIPFGADQPVRVQDTVDDPSFHHISSNHGCVDGVRVLAPGGLCYGFPGMVEDVL